MLQISKKNTVSFRDEVPEKWNHSLWTQRGSFSVSLHLKFLVIFLCHWAFIFLCGQMLLHILFIYYPIYFTVGTNFSWKLKENFSCSFKKLFKTSSILCSSVVHIFLSMSTELPPTDQSILSDCSFHIRFYYQAHLHSGL